MTISVSPTPKDTEAEDGDNRECWECGHWWRWHSAAGCTVAVDPPCDCPVRITVVAILAASPAVTGQDERAGEAAISHVHTPLAGTYHQASGEATCKTCGAEIQRRDREHVGSCRIFYAENRCTCGAAPSPAVTAAEDETGADDER